MPASTNPNSPQSIWCGERTTLQRRCRVLSRPFSKRDFRASGLQAILAVDNGLASAGKRLLSRRHRGAQSLIATLCAFEPSRGWLKHNRVGYRFCFVGRAIGSGWQGPPNLREWGGPPSKGLNEGQSSDGLACPGIVTGTTLSDSAGCTSAQTFARDRRGASDPRFKGRKPVFNRLNGSAARWS